MHLDIFDRKILSLIQRDNRQTAAQLSGKVGLSPSACHRRLQRLREAGVIAADIAVVNPAAVGRRVTLIVSVTLEREQTDVVSAFKRAAREAADVMQCYYVTGSVDFIMILTARSMEAYDAFVERFLFANRNVRRFETYVVMDRVKVGFDLPIDPSPDAGD